MPVDVLAIGAHPDDVELTCAGTLVMLGKRAGDRFGIVDLTRGEMGTRGTAEIRARRKRSGRPRSWAPRSARRSTSATEGLQTGRAAELAVIEVIRREKPRLDPDVLPRRPPPRPPGRGPARHRRGLLRGTAQARDRAPGAPAAADDLLLRPSWCRRPTSSWTSRPSMEVRRAAIRAFSSQFHDPGLERAADHPLAEVVPRA